jgi:hypothetical protein
MLVMTVMRFPPQAEHFRRGVMSGMGRSSGKLSRLTSAERWHPGVWHVAVMLVRPCARSPATVAGWSIVLSLS